MSRLLLLTVAGFLSTSGEAYAPIQMVMKGSVAGLVSLPKGFPGNLKRTFTPQTLSVRDATDNENPSSIPYFTAKPDQTIAWDDMDWCLEAGGDKLGAEIRVNHCTGEPSQKWDWVPDEHGSNIIKLKGTNMCLDAAKQGSGVNGVPLQLQACGNKMPEWKFEDLQMSQPMDAASAPRHVLLAMIALAGAGTLGLGAFMWRLTAKTRALAQARYMADQQGGVSLTGKSLTPARSSIAQLMQVQEVSGPPAQALMQDSAKNAEAESGRGASMPNAVTRFLGRCYEVLCLPFTIFGLSGNLVTVPQGSVGVVTEFGRYTRTLPPGRHLRNIMTEAVKIINLRTVCMDVPPQTCMSKDNLALKIDAVCLYNVLDAQRAAFCVEDYGYALCNLAQVTIRTVLGEMVLQDILNSREAINTRLAQLLHEATAKWGIKVDRVELKDLRISEQMERAMAAKAEAQQEAEAKIIQANAQRDAAAILSDAAQQMSSEPNAIKLQWFETLRVIATQGRNTTIIVPDGMDASSALAAKASSGFTN